MLLIDDIQFIEGKDQMQIEFFHTFNTLYESGKHIVMTCDKPPQSLAKLEERLRTRFGCGLTVDIQPPDYETRVVILKKRAQMNNSNVPEEVLDYIATNIASNIRELGRSFNTSFAIRFWQGASPWEIAKEALKDIISPTNTRKISCDFIMDIVSNYYNVNRRGSEVQEKEFGGCRSKAGRHVFVRNMLDMTFPQIGLDFGTGTTPPSCMPVRRFRKN